MLFQVITDLVKAGADLNSKNTDGYVGFETAIKKGYPPQVLKMLLDSGADPKYKDKHGNTLLHSVMYAEDTDANKMALVVKELIAHGADVKAINEDGCSTLHLALFNSESPLSLLFHDMSMRFI